MLRTQITDAMKDALRAKDERTLATTRLIISRMRDLDIAARPKGNDEASATPKFLRCCRA